jgi:hypothetical protein
MEALMKPIVSTVSFEAAKRVADRLFEQLEACLFALSAAGVLEERDNDSVEARTAKRVAREMLA